MIKANELRIGNRIRVYSDIVEVTDIADDGIIGTTAYFDGQMGCCGCTDSMAEPIPLTPEILEKCGFEQKEVVNSDQDDRTFWAHPKMNYYTYDGKKFDAGYGFGDLDHVKYVHQVQNLFFALTGEELEVKL